MKRLLAGILTAALVLTTLEVSSFAAPNPVPGDENEITEDREAPDDGSGIEDADDAGVIRDESDEQEEGSARYDAGYEDESDEEFFFDEDEGGYMDLEDPVSIQSAGDYPKGVRHALRSGSSLPSTYIPTDLPPLRAQSPYGTCWAFSSIALAELNLLKKGITLPDDLSELHLAYFSYNFTEDPLGGTAGDSNRALGKDFLARGGNLGFSSSVLSAWEGAVNEDTRPYSTASETMTIDAEEAYTDRTFRNTYEDPAAHLTDYYEILLRNAQNEIDWAGMEKAKEYVRDYGGVGISYYSPSGTSSSTSPSVYSTEYNCFYDPELHKATNHAVTIVGWDDTFPAERFPNSQKPAGDGAWLIRNSWIKGGTYENSQKYGGYFWMSYYNATQSDTGYAFIFGPADDYDNNYQYDGSMFSYVPTTYYSAANVFTAHAFGADNGEELRAASFYTNSTNFNYRIEVYTDLPENVTDPTDGTKALTVSGAKEQAGYHTIPFDPGVSLRPGTKFSVVVTLTKSGESPSVGTEVSSTSDWYDIVANIEKGQSFVRNYSGSAWSDLSDKTYGWIGNLKIKAFTVNLDGWTEIPIGEITLEDDLESEGLLLGLGEEYQAAAAISPENTTDKRILWTSSDPDVATVSSKGLVTGVSDGTCVITATARTGSASASFTVTVSKDKLTAVEIGMNGYNGEVVRGKNYRFTLIKTPADAVISGPVSWSSSDPSVMRIDSEGYATALKAGRCVISVTADGKSATKSVTVKPGAPADLEAEADERSVVTLTWTAAEGADHYEVRQEGKTLATISAVSGREKYSYTDESFRDTETNAKKYYYIYAYENGYCNYSYVSVDVGPYHRISYVIPHGKNHPDNPDRYRPGKYLSLNYAVPDEGYQGGQWYSDSGYTQPKYSISYSDSGDLTLYAKIEPIRYSISFYPNGASCGGAYMSSLNNVAYDQEVTLPANTYEMPGAEFMGWNTEQDGSGTSCADGAKVKNLSKTGGGVYLYAQWRYPVTLDPQGGSLGDHPGSIEVFYQRPYGELPVPTKDGYVFLNWSKYAGFNAAVTAETKVSSVSPHTLYARWSQKGRAVYDTEPSAKTGLVYTGEPLDLLTPGSSSEGTVQYRLSPSATYTETVPSATEAGDYTVYYRIRGDADHSDSAESRLTVTINKAASSYTAHPSAIANLRYTGEAITLVNPGETAHGTIYYRVENAPYGSKPDLLPTAVTVGTYRVHYMISGDDNHEASEESTIEVKIEKGTPSCTPPSAIEGLTYTGTYQTLINAGRTSDGTMRYRLGTEGDFAAFLPSAKDTGIYQVYYMIEGDNDHENRVYDTPVTVEIGKTASVVTKLPSAKTGLIYTGEDLSLITAGTATGGTFTYSLSEDGPYSEEIPAESAVGSYQVYYRLEADDDHTAPLNSSGVLTVKIVGLDISGAAVEIGGTYAYTGSAIVPDEIRVVLGDTILDPESDYTVSVTNNVSVGTAVVTATGTGNYEGKARGSFRILPMELSITDVTLENRDYSSGNKAVTVGSVSFENEAGEAVTLSMGNDYEASALMNDDSAGEEKDAAVSIRLLSGNYRLAVSSFEKKVRIGKAPHADMIAVGFGLRGSSASVELRDLLEEGASFGTVSVTEDEAGILDGPPAVEGTKLIFSIRDGEFEAGDEASVSVSVTGARNYSDYAVRATIMFAVCDHNYRVTTIAPTFYSHGLRISTCIKCGHSFREELPQITDGSKLDEEEKKLLEDIDPEQIDKTIETVTDEDGREIEQETVTIGGNVVSTVSTDPKTGKTETVTDIWAVGLAPSYTYTGSAIKPSIRVYDGTKALKLNTDYKLSYGKNVNVSTGGTVKVTFTGNYKTTENRTFPFDITPASMQEVLETAPLAVPAKGSAGKEKYQKPVPSVYWKGTTKALSKKLFNVVYYTEGELSEELTAVKEPGIYTVSITPKTGNFTDELTAVITVTGTTKDEKSANLSNAKITMTPSGKSKIWTGDPITLEAGEDFTVKDALGEELSEGIDYEISFRNNIKPGTATMILTALEDGDYAGMKKQTFLIKKGRLITNEDIVIDYEMTAVYEKGGAKPVPTVTDNGRILKAGTDYSVSYKNNTKVTEDEETAYMIIRGKGNYKGKSGRLYFGIDPKPLDDPGITCTVADKPVGKKGYKKPTVTIKDTNGKKLSGKTDYENTDYSEPDEEGYVTIEISARETNPCYEGTVIASYRYLPASVFLGSGSVRLYRSLPSRIYTGSGITLTDEELSGLLYTGPKKAPVFLTPGADGDFEVLSYTGNVKKGTAKVTLRGINGFAGTRTLSFKITQKKGTWSEDGALVDGGQQ
ncbi:MAG: InlB B-repeat-containing protein [Lachnospiraceae bacterium]|nr:InlB B-repeat-containing protein [Lachnospiraceae bacterium]